MNSFLAEILNDFVALVYPHYCESCAGPLVKGEDILCTSCIMNLPRTHMHLDPSNALVRKFQGRIRVISAAAFLKFRKRGTVQRILHAIKYRNRPEIGYKLGYVYGNELCSGGYMNPYDLIISVPLHSRKKRSRGYNQSDAWARGISDSTRVPFREGILVRVLHSTTQTRSTKLNRWENVEEAFAVTDVDPILNKRILLVDDVVTTGATLESCGTALIKAGCSGVGVACLAIAQ